MSAISGICQDYGLIPPAFKPNYVVSRPDVVGKLQSLIQQADEVYLASDPDREGEAIAWHLKDVFGLSSYKRVTYTAITKADVEAGIANPRELDAPGPGSPCGVHGFRPPVPGCG